MRDLLLDELTPPLLTFRALHPFFIKFHDLIIWFHIELWELPHCVFKYLVIQPS